MRRRRVIRTVLGVLGLLSLLAPKLWLITIAVGFSHAPQVARVLRSATLDLSERDFVKAAELQGMRPAKVMVKEILPNLWAPGERDFYSVAELPVLGSGKVNLKGVQELALSLAGKKD